MDQTCFGSRGFFWPMSNPLFQGRRPLLIGRVDIGGGPPSHPPRRSIASASFILVTDPFWREGDLYTHDVRARDKCAGCLEWQAAQAGE
jgi:hypothetical protein